MTDLNSQLGLTEAERTHMAARYNAERRFRFLGVAAIVASLGFLVFFLLSIFSQGFGAFFETRIRVDLILSKTELGLKDNYAPEDLRKAKYRNVIRKSLREAFPEALNRSEKRELYGLLGAGAEYELRDFVINDPDRINTLVSLWITSSDVLDL